MANGNTMTIVGNLVEDPELRWTPAGRALAKLRIAHNRSWRDQSGERQEETSFFNGTVWGDMAENVGESLRKGDRVIVTGSLNQRSWETDAGDRRSVVELRIDDIAPSVKYASVRAEKRKRERPATEPPW